MTEQTTSEASLSAALVIPSDHVGLVSKTVGLLTAVTAIVRSTDKFAVEDPAAYAQGANQIRSVREVKTQLEETRVALKAPFLEAGRKIDGFFKSPITSLDDAEKGLNKRMQIFQKGVEQKQREAEAAALAAHKETLRLAAVAAAEAAAAAAALDGPPTVVTHTPSVPPSKIVVPPPEASAYIVPTPLAAQGVTKTKTAKVTNVDINLVIAAAAAGNMDAYAILEIATPKLNALVKAQKLGLKIPGVTVEEVESLVVR